MTLRTSVFTFTPAATSFSTRLHDDTVKKASEKQPRRRSLPFLRQHRGFQYHQEVPEGHLLLEVLRGLWDQVDRADPNTDEETTVQ